MGGASWGHLRRDRQRAVVLAIVLAFVYALTLVVPAGLEPIQRTLNIWLEDRAVAEVDQALDACRHADGRPCAHRAASGPG